MILCKPLPSRKEEFKWTHEMEEAFYNAMEGIIEKVPTLDTSWNKFGISPIVLQKNGNDNVAESRYSPSEGEAWTGTWGVIKTRNVFLEASRLSEGMIHHAALSVINLSLVEDNLRSQFIKLCDTGYESPDVNMPYEMPMEKKLIVRPQATMDKNQDYYETSTWGRMAMIKEEDLSNLSVKRNILGGGQGLWPAGPEGLGKLKEDLVRNDNEIILQCRGFAPARL